MLQVQLKWGFGTFINLLYFYPIRGPIDLTPLLYHMRKQTMRAGGQYLFVWRKTHLFFHEIPLRIQTLNGATNENFKTGNNSSPIQTHGQPRLTMCALWELSQRRSWWVDVCRILPYFHFSALREIQSLLLHFRFSFRFRHCFPTISFTMLDKREDLTLIDHSNKGLADEEQPTEKAHYLPLSATNNFSWIHTVTGALPFGLLW